MYSQLLPNPFSADFIGGCLEGYAALEARTTPFRLVNDTITALNDKIGGTLFGKAAPEAIGGANTLDKKVKQLDLTPKADGETNAKANPFYDAQIAAENPTGIIVPKPIKDYGSTALKVYGITLGANLLKNLPESLSEVPGSLYSAFPNAQDLRTVYNGTPSASKGLSVIFAANYTISAAYNLWDCAKAGTSFISRGLTKLQDGPLKPLLPSTGTSSTAAEPDAAGTPTFDDHTRMLGLLAMAYKQIGDKMLTTVQGKLTEKNQQDLLAVLWKGVANENLLKWSQETENGATIADEMKKLLELNQAEVAKIAPSANLEELATAFGKAIGTTVADKETIEQIELRNKLTLKFEETKKIMIAMQQAGQAGPTPKNPMLADAINCTVAGVKAAGGLLASIGYLSDNAAQQLPQGQREASLTPQSNTSSALRHLAGFTRNSIDHFLKLQACGVAAMKTWNLAKAGYHGIELMMTKDEAIAAQKKEAISKNWNEFTSGLHFYALSLAYHNLVPSPSVGDVVKRMKSTTSELTPPNGEIETDSWGNYLLSTPILAVPFLVKTAYDVSMCAMNATKEYLSDNHEVKVELAKKKVTHWNNFVLDFFVLMEQWQTSFYKHSANAIASGMEYTANSLDYNSFGSLSPIDRLKENTGLNPENPSQALKLFDPKLTLDQFVTNNGLLSDGAKYNKTYKKLSFQVHPDKPGGDNAVFQRLGLAKKTLDTYLNRNKEP